MSYIWDLTNVYTTKSDLVAPSGDPTKTIAAVDMNAIKTAFETDTRAAFLAGKGHGFQELAAAPSVSGMGTFLWGKTDGTLNFHRSATDYNIPYGAVSVKGDGLFWGGSAWVVLSAGANGTIMTADSTTGSGAKWAAPVGAVGNPYTVPIVSAIASTALSSITWIPMASGLGGLGFNNSYVDFAPTAGFATSGYYKDAFGYVVVRLAAKSGTNGTSLFTFPAKFRPTSTLQLPASVDGNTGAVVISTTGDIQAASGGNTWVINSLFRFPAEQ